MKLSRASLHDVAAHAGLSLATVSRVLSGSTYSIREETRKRVEQSARELGYRPNAIARALATNVNRTIGVIIGDITDIYFAELVRGVEDIARSQGYMTVICNAERSPVQEMAYLRALHGQNVAAILLAGGYYPDSDQNQDLVETIQEVAREVRVTCLTDRHIPGIPVVTVDIHSVTYDITRYVIGLGHKRIAYVRGPDGFSVSLDQQRGFEDAMHEVGLDASWQLSGGFGLEYGRQAATFLLANALPDAIIAASDDVAVGITSTLRQAGIAVPGGISVAGIDDAKYSQLLDLTTVRLPAYEIGATGAKLALGIRGNHKTPRTIIAHRVIVRGSTALGTTVGSQP
ncbi:LacI family DNA-binding transcriptional regulator [Devosia sp. 2618]|uniref:LacI family DNA-binding transcriptional regulator n=1 Tax=Devosia sp. 2618 TaxID=3156454 RepID=UPI0033990623